MPLINMPLMQRVLMQPKEQGTDRAERRSKSAESSQYCCAAPGSTDSPTPPG